ncbi:unnamed protein product [Bathycoccus prasinos]
MTRLMRRPIKNRLLQTLLAGRSLVGGSESALLNKVRYLVDPASSHMLVSKIKPCMSKYKRYTVKLRMAH